MKKEAIRWKPLSWYLEEESAWYSPRVVLLGGMMTNADSLGCSVGWYSLGYWSKRKRRWVNCATQEPYPDSPISHPQYFALVCRDIQCPEKRDDYFCDGFDEEKWKKEIHKIKVISWQK